MKKISDPKTWTALVFVAMIALPILSIRWTGGEYSQAEKRFLAGWPALFSQDGTLAAEAGSSFKSWFEDHIGFREKLVALHAQVRSGLFRLSPSDRVHIGKDGWYYYTLDENLEISTGRYTLTQETLEQILSRHLAVRDKLAGMGIDYVILLPTSKVSIYPEYMRYGDGQIRETPVDIVADYLEERSDLKVVRLKEALLEEKKDRQVYFKTDTHWTQEGAYAAYREIVRRMQEWGLCETGPIDVAFADTTFTGELGAMMGLELPAEPAKEIVFPRKDAVLDPPTQRSARFSQAVAAAGVHDPCRHFENGAAQGPNVLMFGDSMFGGWNATDLLAEHFPEFSYVWSTDIDGGILEAMEPDVVIYELTERYWNVFPSKNRGFIQTALDGHQAEVVSYEWEGETLRVTVRNSSAWAWSGMDWIRLGVFKDGMDTGLRADMPGSEVVDPGEEIVFTIDLEDGATSSGVKVEVQMLQEGICYFGQRVQVAGAPG